MTHLINKQINYMAVTKRFPGKASWFDNHVASNRGIVDNFF